MNVFGKVMFFSQTHSKALSNEADIYSVRNIFNEHSTCRKETNRKRRVSEEREKKA